jgi:hypothetical protein
MSEREKQHVCAFVCVHARARVHACSCVHSTWVGVHMHSCRPYNVGIVPQMLVLRVVVGKRRAKECRTGL